MDHIEEKRSSPKSDALTHGNVFNISAKRRRKGDKTYVGEGYEKKSGASFLSEPLVIIW